MILKSADKHTKEYGRKKNVAEKKNEEKRDEELWKEFKEKVNTKVKEAQSPNKMVDVTDIMFSLMRKKYNDNDYPRNHEEIMFQMIRPEMPFNKWMPDLMPWMKRSTKSGNAEHESHQETFVLLNECLKEISVKEASFPLDDLDIKTKLEVTMNNVLEYLKANHEMFQNSTLLHTGSMYEGLKIQNIDEFDFMIELPAMTNIIEINTKFSHELLSSTLLDLKPFYDLPINKVAFDVDSMNRFFDRVNSKQTDDCKTLKSCLENKVNVVKASFNADEPNHCFNMAIIMRTLAILIEEKIADFLPDETWQLIPRESKDNLITMRHSLQQYSAFTYDLNIAGNIVNIDVALAIPVKNLPLVINHNKIAANHLPDDYKERFEKNPIFHHAIFRNSDTVRISLSCKEKEILVKMDQNDQRKICIRFVKLLCKHFITKLKFGDEEPTSLLNSYHIKTVFFFLFQKYPEDGDWNSDHFFTRVREALVVLKKCFAERTLESYFIPYYNTLKKYVFMDKKGMERNDADVAVEDIDRVLELFCDMQQLNSESALKMFYDTIERAKHSIVRVLTLEERKKRFTNSVEANLL